MSTNKKNIVVCTCCGKEQELTDMKMSPAVESYYRQFAMSLLGKAEPPVFKGEWDTNFYCNDCYVSKFESVPNSCEKEILL